ncbi:MAG TPA: hypothetical protein DCE44_15260 [Verrucomicrobiales bacterium]|nr:hypothetical protein [Verrucomicrobiales bacterium]
MNSSSPAIRYVAEPTHAREVSLVGTADLAFWVNRLRKENLRPVERNGRAQILIIGAEMTFMGIRFTEVAFSVPVLVPGCEKPEAVFLCHAFNSCRLFAFCERRLFATPYSHAQCRVSVSESVSIRIMSDGRTVFLTAMSSESPTTKRELLRTGEESWEGPVFLPRNGYRRAGGRDARLFFGRIRGHTRVFPFVQRDDTVMVMPSGDCDILEALLDSEFVGEEWLVRPDATHGKSKSYRRSECGFAGEGGD